MVGKGLLKRRNLTVGSTGKSPKLSTIEMGRVTKLSGLWEVRRELKCKGLVA